MLFVSDLEPLNDFSKFFRIIVFLDNNSLRPELCEKIITDASNYTANTFSTTLINYIQKIKNHNILFSRIQIVMVVNLHPKIYIYTYNSFCLQN